MKKLLTVISQVVKYSISRKKYWLVPFAIILVTLAVVIFVSQGSIVAPFIYTLF